MVTLKTSWVRRQIGRIKPVTVHMSVELIRSVQDKVGSLGAKVMAGKMDVEIVDFPDFSAAFIHNKKPEVGKGVLLYLHGGGYVSGNIAYAQGFGNILADRTGRDVFCAAYRLAPEHPFPAALEDALTAYEYLLSKGYTPDDIAFVGESAGGGLIYCLCLYLQDRGLPLPKALVGISPWTDLTCSGGSYINNSEKDPSLKEELLRHYSFLYAGENVANPLVSPIFGNLSALPPSLLFVGGDEIILDDTIMLSKRLQECGSPCTLHIEEGLWHVYVLYPIAEAKAAWAEIVSFLEENSV